MSQPAESAEPGAGSLGVILAAGGSGRRFGGRKQFLELAGRPVIEHSLDLFASLGALGQLVIVVPADAIDATRDLVEVWRRRGAATITPRDCQVIAGGSERQESVARGVAALVPAIRWVLVHDAARPLLRADDLTRLLEVLPAGGVALGHPATDSVHEAPGGRVEASLDRSRIWQVQTPQGGRRDWLEAALGEASRAHSDEVALLRSVGHPVQLVEGARDNLKITQPGDLALAEFLLERRGQVTATSLASKASGGMRVGFGTDNHRLEEGRKLWIGGLEIPSPVGEVAHSDGDVLLHALTDALLGAVGEGDIGEHFPDTDPRWKGQASEHFVREAARIVADRGFRIVNIDATISLEKVKLRDHKRAIADRIRAILAEHRTLEPGEVNVKAKTNERCDAVGEGRAIAAYVAVLLEPSPIA